LTEGVEIHRIEGETVRVYSVAKTIADSFKYRNKIALDVALEGSSRATSPNRSAVGVSRVVVKIRLAAP
jgi:hypothetical protein